MKITLVKPPLFGHAFRGTGEYTDNLFRSLSKISGVDVELADYRNSSLSSDIIHYPYFDPFFLTLPWRKKQPTVVTVHDLTPLVFSQHFPAGIKGAIKWQIQKLLLRQSGAIITDSTNSKKDIKKLTGFPEEKIFVIYLAPALEFKTVDDPEKLATVREKYHLPEKFVLYVGDVTWNKNLPRLIEAVKKINIKLVMVGKALTEKNFDRKNIWNHDLIEVQKVCQGNERIIRLGFVPREDLVEIYNLATVFAMPSIYEGFGLPVLEAMACGCPVVVGRSSSLPEIAESAAIYVDPFDVASIAEGTARVISFNTSDFANYENLRKLSLAQAKNFNWGKVAKQTLGVYEKVVSKTYPGV